MEQEFLSIIDITHIPASAPEQQQQHQRHFPLSKILLYCIDYKNVRFFKYTTHLLRTRIVFSIFPYARLTSPTKTTQTKQNLKKKKKGTAPYHASTFKPSQLLNLPPNKPPSPFHRPKKPLDPPPLSPVPRTQRIHKHFAHGKLFPNLVTPNPASAYLSHPLCAYASNTTAGTPRCRCSQHPRASILQRLLIEQPLNTGSSLCGLSAAGDGSAEQKRRTLDCGREFRADADERHVYCVSVG